jgi:cytochrome c biogenesis protein CcdA/glutaredoxin
VIKILFENLEEKFCMKRSIALQFAIILALTGMIFLGTVKTVVADIPGIPLGQVTPPGPQLPQAQEAEPLKEGAVGAYYFYANDCPHCIAMLEDLILPLSAEYGDKLDVRLLEIGKPEYYEAMLTIESYFEIAPMERGIPTMVIDNQILIGEEAIRGAFTQLVSEGVEQGGIPFPDIPGVNSNALVSVDPDFTQPTDEACDEDEEVCEVEAPIYVAYFYQTGCKECSRVEADLKYLRTQYPQMQVVDFNIYDHADMAAWLMEQIGYEEDFQTPAVVIGEVVLVAEEILPETMQPILERYEAEGVEPLWLDFDPEEGRQTIVERFRDMGWMAVVFAGLIDGINPCAFATLIFFVSYLTLSGRQGKEVLWVGGGFTLGVFLAYLVVGLGLYQVLEMVSETLDLIAKIVYAVTGIFCLVLAVMSFLDYKKAKEGNIHDMLLTLPEVLRKRINTTIRSGRKTQNYVLGAFGAGILISFLELACTGQVYLPTIIFVSSIPELRLQAFLYLVLYNLLFILPLVVIFVLVYFGTTSKDLTRFLQEKAAAVKFAMSLVFIALGSWLIVSLVI